MPQVCRRLTRAILPYGTCAHIGSYEPIRVHMAIWHVLTCGKPVANLRQTWRTGNPFGDVKKMTPI